MRGEAWEEKASRQILGQGQRLQFPGLAIDRNALRWGDARGVTLVLLLATMVIMGIGLAVVGRQWTFIIQRELEADLLAKGLEIQN